MFVQQQFEAQKKEKRDSQKLKSGSAPAVNDLVRAQLRSESLPDERTQTDIQRSRDKNAIYEAAISIFEARKGGKASPSEWTRLWEEAEKEAAEATEKETITRRDGRPSRRPTRVRAGTEWLSLEH